MDIQKIKRIIHTLVEKYEANRDLQGTTAWVDNNNKTFGEVFPKEK